ncbi:MAG: geranylgeranyl diphosphate reductase [Jannaschia sp.]
MPNQTVDVPTLDVPTFDVVVIGGGPSGATAAHDLAHAGRNVALIDKAGRIKPCGGAIPPRAVRDFEIPEDMLVAKINTARMISPTGRKVDIPIEDGYVGMVDREHFDEFLRIRAADAGATRLTGTFQRIERAGNVQTVIYRDKASGETRRLDCRLVIGADGARSGVARAEVKGGKEIPYVIAYHEIIEAPAAVGSYDPTRCDVVYDGAISPDFYGWVFPHGGQASVGMGTCDGSVDLKEATRALRSASGLTDCATIRKEGAPIPLRPLDKWDNGTDLVLAGDAAGVVAPSSGEGIFYAMVGGRVAAVACEKVLTTDNPKHLALARKLFMKDHKAVFKILGAMQDAYYRSDERRERFVTLCHDVDVQRLTFEAYMNKELVRARPLAHIKIGIKNVAHLLGIVPAMGRPTPAPAAEPTEA